MICPMAMVTEIVNHAISNPRESGTELSQAGQRSGRIGGGNGGDLRSYFGGRVFVRLLDDVDR